MRAAGRAFVAALALALAAALIAAMLALPAGQGELPLLVGERLHESGVAHPVTAVLLNFRAYDTLLEIGVLLLAVLGVLAIRPAPARFSAAPHPGGPVLAVLVAISIPLLIVTGIYLLWAGSHAPGGAFQAGALLAAAGVLARLTDRLPGLLPPRAALRAALMLGFGVFLLAAALGPAAGRAFLAYPPGLAGPLILLIESALAVSIALILVSLFLGAPAPEDEG